MRFIHYFLALISGFALTLQVGINGELRSKIGSPILSSLISFAVGTIVLTVTFFFTVLSGYSSSQNLINIKNTNWWMFTGGLLGAFYIFTTIFTSPKIGFANMFSLVICGQIILAVIFDHFGLLGNQIHTINSLRVLGVILLILGVYIIQTH
ncbi:MULTISPECIES: DMT family transporter [unclassified Clostridium]|uniref:DMT family transporter n=1 Tax=unclassified Clostridium TaxID=2614128 RepID=UPI000EE98197|nr:MULTISPECIES: DMT family transporter [unclassified Clostridium]HCQ88827.1 EamA-like transporter family protein [Clostridium sp.]